MIVQKNYFLYDCGSIRWHSVLLVTRKRLHWNISAKNSSPFITNCIGCKQQSYLGMFVKCNVSEEWEHSIYKKIICAIMAKFSLNEIYCLKKTIKLHSSVLKRYSKTSAKWGFSGIIYNRLCNKWSLHSLHKKECHIFEKGGVIWCWNFYCCELWVQNIFHNHDALQKRICCDSRIHIADIIARYVRRRSLPSLEK